MFRKKSDKLSAAPTLFTPRKNDYLNHHKQNQPLEIDHARFVRPAHEIATTGGSATYGPYFVSRKNSDKQKLYYVAEHDVADEYFSLEILQYLGINTPKLRIVKGSFSNRKHQPALLKKNCATKVAVKGIEFYLTMYQLIEPSKTGYHLDASTQLVSNSDHSLSFKVSGNVFSAFIAASLIDDTDFGCESYNFGMTRVGNRFYSAAIDKDCAKFKDPIILHIRYKNLAIFKSTCRDQELWMISRIADGLKPDSDGICDFDRIFDNKRVRITPDLANNHQQKCENFKHRAASIIALYQLDDHNCLEKFRKREVTRVNLAEKVLDLFNFPDGMKKEQIIPLIVEDLRGPYYLHLFKQKQLGKADMINNKLLDAITESISTEFDRLILKRSDKSQGISQK